MHIPPEILQKIAQNLHRHDLKQLRLTCKGISEYITPYLFDSLFISTKPLDVEAAEQILIHFQTLVRTIIVSPLKYRVLSKLRYKQRVRYVRDFKSLPYRSRFEEHIEMGYKQYCIVQKRAEQMESEISMHAFLRKALQSAPNV